MNIDMENKNLLIVLRNEYVKSCAIHFDRNCNCEFIHFESIDQRDDYIKNHKGMAVLLFRKNADTFTKVVSHEDKVILEDVKRECDNKAIFNDFSRHAYHNLNVAPRDIKQEEVECIRRLLFKSYIDEINDSELPTHEDILLKNVKGQKFKHALMGLFDKSSRSSSFYHKTNGDICSRRSSGIFVDMVGLLGWVILIAAALTVIIKIMFP